MSGPKLPDGTLLAVPQPSQYAGMRQLTDWTTLENLRRLAEQPGNSGCRDLYRRARREYLERWAPHELSD